MPKTYRVRATATMPEHQAKVLAYRTRMLQADITDGHEFDLSQSDAVPLLKARWVENAPEQQASVRRGPGRPPKAPEPEPKPEPEPWAEDEPGAAYLENMTVGELRALAEERGIELPSGYLKRDDLIGLLEQSGIDA